LQVQPIAHALSAVLQDVEIEQLAVHSQTPEERAEVYGGYIERKADFAAVLAIKLSKQYAPINSTNIRAAFAPTPLITIANFHFTGVQPDIAYVKGVTGRIPGRLGDYHSRLALIGFLLGLPAERCASLFQHTVYDTTGYYGAFEEASVEAKRREAGVQIPGTPLIERFARRGMCFMSQNHPTSFLIAPYATLVARKLAARGLVETPRSALRHKELVNLLGYGPVFPIFPEIARRHEMPLPGNYVFRTATAGNIPSRALSLQQFLEQEYAAFGVAGTDRLARANSENPAIRRSLKDESLHNFLMAVATR